MNRIEQKFQDLKKQGRKAFIAFVTAGDPDLKTTEELVLSFAASGVDIIELGVPFSDPLADGPTIQAASDRAIHNGVNIEKILKLVKRVRQKTEIPIALMTYYNPVFHYGDQKFIQDLKAAGGDGVIIPDLPPEEAKELMATARQSDIATIFFLAPTTTAARAKKIAQASTGFIYYVSLTGVTGARKAANSAVNKQVKSFKKLTNKPICVGFGVSTPEQVKELSKVSDGVIVGSAIINEILKYAGKKNLVQSVSGFVKKLAAAVSGQ